jgi:hypothetical protein
VSNKDEQDRLRLVAEQIGGPSVLGRSRTLQALFDYLLDRTLKNEPPKEIEIAMDVFGRSQADGPGDASVRVQVHRLRRKLETYYASDGRDDDERLILPKGEYRFQLVAASDDQAGPTDRPAESPADLPPARAGRQRWLFLLIGLVVGALLAVVPFQLWTRDPLADLRGSAVWRSLIASGRTLTIVTGDYYIVGERDTPGADPTRLVRDFSINSREDLAELFMRDPALRDRYVDLNLYYLPVSTAYAMKAVLPVLAPRLGGRRPSFVVPSSRFTASRLKDGDIVYVGLLSGLGLLSEPAFANSRFAPGGSYDEIFDIKTNRLYAADPPGDQTLVRRNYAYIAHLPGPNGNHIFIVAGTRDPALLQAADILSSPDTVRQLEAAAKGGYFEALFAVDGVGEDNLRGTLIAAAPRSPDGIWDAAEGADGRK